MTTLSDIRNQSNKSVWFNSRFYRANLLWKGKSFRFRDIHLFNEKFESPYFRKAGNGNQFLYFTLPIVDGFMWSRPDDLAGLRIMRTDKYGNKKEVALDNPVVTEIAKDVLKVECNDEKSNVFNIIFYEDHFEVSCKTKEKDFNWILELVTASGIELPFKSIEKHKINAEFNNFKYGITCDKGSAKKSEDASGAVFQIIPSNNLLIINCTNSN